MTQDLKVGITDAVEGEKVFRLDDPNAKLAVQDFMRFLNTGTVHFLRGVANHLEGRVPIDESDLQRTREDLAELADCLGRYLNFVEGLKIDQQSGGVNG